MSVGFRVLGDGFVAYNPSGAGDTFVIPAGGYLQPTPGGVVLFCTSSVVSPYGGYIQTPPSGLLAWERQIAYPTVINAGEAWPGGVWRAAVPVTGVVKEDILYGPDINPSPIESTINKAESHMWVLVEFVGVPNGRNGADAIVQQTQGFPISGTMTLPSAAARTDNVFFTWVSLPGEPRPLGFIDYAQLVRIGTGQGFGLAGYAYNDQQMQISGAPFNAASFLLEVGWPNALVRPGGRLRQRQISSRQSNRRAGRTNTYW